MPVSALIICTLLCSIAADHSAVLAVSPPRKYSLQELISSAMNLNTEISETRWQVESASAQLRQARAARFLPRLRLQSENGLVPDARGDLYNPPEDTTGIRDMGPFSRTELEFVQPLYTFGQLSHLKEAAVGGLAVEEASLAQKRLDVALEISKLYYGVLLAQDLQDLVRRLSDELETRREELEDDDTISLSNSYKLQLTLLELEKQEGEATRQLELGRAVLAWQAGLSDDQPLVLEAESLTPIEADLPTLDLLVDQALKNRPDWRKLQAGLAARRAQHAAARSAYYPQIFLAGGLRYAVAPGRTDQHNPFVKDEFNYFNGGLFVGLRQSFEFGLLGADIDKARAAYRQLEAKESGATRGIHLDVQRAYVEFQQADAALNTASQSRQLARQWLKLAQDEYEFDPDELKELVTAFESWAKLEQSYYEAIYEFNISLAELEKTIGGIPLRKRQ